MPTRSAWGQASPNAAPCAAVAMAHDAATRPLGGADSRSRHDHSVRVKPVERHFPGTRATKSAASCHCSATGRRHCSCISEGMAIRCRFGRVAYSGVACAWLLTACGGTVSQGGGGSGAGAPGSGGQTVGAAGGSAVAGSPGSAGSFGGSGAAAAGGRSGSTGCVVAGRTFAEGEKVPSNDDCNSCFCTHGDVACTDEVCLNRCEAVRETYSQALELAKRCDPTRPNQCTAQAVGDLACGCSTFVNSAQAESLTNLKMAQQRYSESSCDLSFYCGPCTPRPSQSVCSPDGRCEDVVSAPAACKVGGKIYPSGAGGIPDPTSCNECSCYNGQLACTEVNCPIACPPNSVPSTQCAACGPTDGCDVVEFGCLPVCTSSCASGACVNGVCRSICG